MLLSIEQTRALDSIRRWLQNPIKQTFVLAGYAGTGKTTLLQHFINQQSDPVTCLTPTGKAASVLQNRLSNARVSTIHSAIYKPVDQNISHLNQLEAELLVNHPGNQFLIEAIEQEKRRLATNAEVKFSLKQDCKISPGQLVVVDEASMVTRFMKRDLEATRAKILYVGDPGQLPPVQDKGFFWAHAPDVMLATVQRQALDSPIIRVSMEIRAGNTIDFQELEGFRKMPKESLPAKDWLTFDQVITGTNDARRHINRYFRAQKDYRSWWPCAGDKLICLRNENDDGIYYINGVQAIALTDAMFIADFQEVMGDIIYEGAVIHGIPFYRYPFQVHYDANVVEDPLQSRRGLVQDFDYAYAITVHKSQGSEWDNVLLADDGMKTSDKAFRKRWLYTAVTRAKKKLTWLT